MARYTREKRAKVRGFPILILMAITIILGYKTMTVPDGQHLYEENAEDKNGRVQSLNMESDSYLSISPDSLCSPYAILLRLDDNTILMDKLSKEKIYPASLTKMMTAIVAIENLPDLHKGIELTHYTFEGLYSANASMAGFQPGEMVRAIDLLYGVMLPSGAESCIALADEIAGSEQDFVVMMNQKAADLGMNYTHFTNAIGLHHENHYTTVEDLAVLLNYALQNNTFREIFSSEYHTTQATNKHPDGITLYSTMFKEISNLSIIEGEILGGKTGYTEEAGLCLASLAKKDGNEYILITAGAKGDHYSEQYNNGQQKWQISNEDKEIVLLPPVPDPTGSSFALRDEAKRAKEYPHTVVGQELIAGRQTTKLAISPPGGREYHLWVDTETNLPIQLQAAMQNALQTTYTFVSFEPNTEIDPRIFAYQVPEGYRVVEDNPGQVVATIEEAAAISGLTPLLPEQAPTRIMAMQDRIILAYGDTTIMETNPEGDFELAAGAALGTAAEGPLEAIAVETEWY